MIILSLVTVIHAPIFAQDFSDLSFSLKAGPEYFESAMAISFLHGKVMIPELDDTTRAVQGGDQYRLYKIVTENSIPFLLIPERSQKFVMFTNGEYLLLYDKNNLLKYEAGDTYPGRNLVMVKATYTATSFLEEKLASGNVSYPAENLGDYSRLEKPWVNGGNRYATGDKITITFSEPVSRLWISNGYVSADKPQYFAFNSRVKKTRIADLTNANSFDFVLKDTPDLQCFDLPAPALKVEITILEVYPGTK